jgi:chromosome condensin MukBEF complex kleisin-like MukF subunit
MNSKHSEMVDQIVRKVWNEAVIYARAEENQDLTVRPMAIAGQECRDEITQLLDKVERDTVERCAKVADELKGSVCDGGYVDCPIPEQIATAIRNLLNTEREKP